jgi:hypothetical protein
LEDYFNHEDKVMLWFWWLQTSLQHSASYKCGRKMLLYKSDLLLGLGLVCLLGTTRDNWRSLISGWWWEYWDRRWRSNRKIGKIAWRGAS